MAKSRLFSAGTPASALVWARKVGGVSFVTWRSFERLSISSCVGFSPSRLLQGAGMTKRGRQRDHGVDENHPVGTRADAFDGVIGVGLCLRRNGCRPSRPGVRRPRSP